MFKTRTSSSIVAICLAAASLSPARAIPSTPPPAQAIKPADASDPTSFAEIIERVAPAVVSIDVRRPPPPQPDFGQGFPSLPFPFRFGAPDNNDKARADARISGSGFFISPTGYIVTNNHVVDDATKVSVRLNDGRELNAEVVGRDALTDLAVLKVEGSGFSYVSFETHAKPRVGDWVIAMGNPFGLGGTATSGIISAYGRDIGEAYVDYLQIDAPINHGNSGGPTFDIHGQVIGVNTAIFSPSGGSVGIGLAIPADVADHITKQLIANGAVTRGFIGATIQNITPDIADSLGLANRKGALVAEIAPGGPAEKAGVKSGDAILSLNGQPLTSSADLTRRVGETRPGDRLTLQIQRGGRALTLELVSGERPAEAKPDKPNRPSESVLGLVVRPLDEAARQRLGLGRDIAGVLVMGVSPGSDAAQKGLRRGDVITRASEHQVTSGQDLQAAVAAARKLGRSSVLLRVWRGGRALFVPVEIGS